MNEGQYPEYPLLVVDDDKDFLESVSDTLELNGIDNISLCQKSNDVMPLLEKKKFSLILLDIAMPEKNGDEILLEITEKNPEIPVIMLTAQTNVETVVNCMKNGATDYINKPITDPYRLLNTIKRTLDLIEYKKENSLLKKSYFNEKPDNLEFFSEIITKSPKMWDIFNYIESVAISPRPVLITGETGTGKELVARAIHKASRRKGNFIADNAASWDENLFSDTIFGHEKGAFTDANRNRRGLVESAHDGTLFLDEIGDVPMRGQVKLLRFLQEKEYFSLGGENKKKANTRIVAATNRDLKAMIKMGEFRQDLYYRFQQHYIHLPPLRERKEDIPLLVEHFIKKAARELNKKIPNVPGDLYPILSTYNFPGNIRELESMIFDAFSRSQTGKLSIDTIITKIREQPQEKVSPDPIPNAGPGVPEVEKVLFVKDFPTLLEMKRIYTNEAMKRAGNNQSLAAQLAGVPRTTFVNLFKKVKKN